jgi:hypothetical protein
MLFNPDCRPSLHRLAVHEAGHLIIQTLLFGPPDVVRVRRRVDGSIDAHVRPSPKKPEHLERAKSLAERNERRLLIAVYEAGRLAEEVLGPDETYEDGCSWRYGYYGERGSDDAVIKALLSAATDGDDLPSVEDDWFETIGERTRVLLQQHENALKSLVTEIAPRGELAGEALHALLARYGIRQDEAARSYVTSYQTTTAMK